MTSSLPLSFIKALQNGQLHRAFSLVPDCASIPFIDSCEHTVIDYTLHLGPQELLQALVDHGALLLPSMKNHYSKSLSLSIRLSNSDAFETLLASPYLDPFSSVDNESSPFLNTITYGQEDFLKRLTHHPLFQPLFLNQSPPHQYTPLREASTMGYYSIVQFLLNQGVDVNQEHPTHLSPLFLAISQGYLDVVQILLDHGADPLLLSSRKKINAIDYSSLFLDSDHGSAVHDLLIHWVERDRLKQTLSTTTSSSNILRL